LFKNLFLPLYFVEEGLEVGVEISFVFNVVNVIDVKGEMVESVGGRTFESFFFGLKIRLVFKIYKIIEILNFKNSHE